MDIIISGIISQALPVQSGVSQRSGQPWAKGAYVIQHEQGQYPKYLCFEVFGQDNLNNFNLQVGEQVTIHLNADSHANPKNPAQWFNEIRCWKVERGQMMQQQGMPMQQGYQQSMYQQPMQQGYQPQQGYQQMPQQAPVQQPMQQVAPTPFPPQQPAAQPAPQAQAPAQGTLPFPPPPAQ